MKLAIKGSVSNQDLNNVDFNTKLMAIDINKTESTLQSLDCMKIELLIANTKQC